MADGRWMPEDASHCGELTARALEEAREAYRRGEEYQARYRQKDAGLMEALERAPQQGERESFPKGEASLREALGQNTPGSQGNDEERSGNFSKTPAMSAKGPHGGDALWERAGREGEASLRAALERDIPTSRDDKGGESRDCSKAAGIPSKGSNGEDPLEERGSGEGEKNFRQGTAWGEPCYDGEERNSPGRKKPQTCSNIPGRQGERGPSREEETILLLILLFLLWQEKASPEILLALLYILLV